MHESPDAGSYLEDALSLTIQYARSGEKLIAAVGTLLPVATALADLKTFDPALAPEIDAAFENVREAVAVLRRANDFQDARYSTALARLRGESQGPQQEGDSQ